MAGQPRRQPAVNPGAAPGLREGRSACPRLRPAPAGRRARPSPAARMARAARAGTPTRRAAAAAAPSRSRPPPPSRSRVPVRAARPGRSRHSSSASTAIGRRAMAGRARARTPPAELRSDGFRAGKGPNPASFPARGRRLTPLPLPAGPAGGAGPGGAWRSARPAPPIPHRRTGLGERSCGSFCWRRWGMAPSPSCARERSAAPGRGRVSSVFPMWEPGAQGCQGGAKGC